MACVPELSVSKRKTLPVSKVAKRLRRFVRDNQLPDAVVPRPDGADLGNDQDNAVQELVCPVPDETLHQLQQIYEALELSKPDRRTSVPTVSHPEPSSPTFKTPSKKRARSHDAPATEILGRRGAKAKASKSKRERRKSSAT